MIGNAPGPGATIGLLGGQIISTVQEELFVAGKAFSFEEYFEFAVDEVKNFIFDSSAYAGANLTFNPITFSGSAGPILIDFYTGTVANDDGTVQVASNRREGFPAPASIISLNPTGLTLGTRFSGDLVPATGTAPANSSGGANMPTLPFEIDASVKHAFTMTNTDGAAVQGLIKMTWFEV